MDIDEAWELLRPFEGSTLSVDAEPIRSLDAERYRAATRFDDARVTREHPQRLPLLYLTSVLGWTGGPPESQLGADGLDPAIAAGLPDTGLRFMGAGQDLTFHREPVIDVPISVTSTIEKVQLKSGRDQPFIMIAILRAYADKAGPLFDCHETFIVR